MDTDKEKAIDQAIKDFKAAAKERHYRKLLNTTSRLRKLMNLPGVNPNAGIDGLIEIGRQRYVQRWRIRKMPRAFKSQYKRVKDIVPLDNKLIPSVKKFQSIQNGMLNSLYGETNPIALRNYLDTFARKVECPSLMGIPREHVAKVCKMLLGVKDDMYELIRHNSIEYYDYFFNCAVDKKHFRIWIGNECRLIEFQVRYSAGTAISCLPCVTMKDPSDVTFEAFLHLRLRGTKWEFTEKLSDMGATWSASLDQLSLKAIKVDVGEKYFAGKVVEVLPDPTTSTCFMSRYPIAYSEDAETRRYYIDKAFFFKAPTGEWVLVPGSIDGEIPREFPSWVKVGDFVRIENFAYYSERDIYKIEKLFIEKEVPTAVVTKQQYSIFQTASKKVYTVPVVFLSKVGGL